MATAQFLIKNRHDNRWVGRIIIPLNLRAYFDGRKEIRHSLNTSDKVKAKHRSMQLWLDCQRGFERLKNNTHINEAPFRSTTDFLAWLSPETKPGRWQNMVFTKTTDALGKKHTIDLADPAQEVELTLQLHENAAALLEKYQDNPEILDRLLKAQEAENSNTPEKAASNQPETPSPFNETIDFYITKLETQGRRGKKLAPRTLSSYRDKLTFWKAHFGDQPIHTIDLKMIAETQTWLPYLASNFAKKGLSVEDAIKEARNQSEKFPPISDKTRADYLGQLKGLLEYAFSSGSISSDYARHIEIPNTKHGKSIERLPFTDADLKQIFPENYGIDFGIHKAGLDDNCKYWFPLLALYSGARIEELGQLKTSDIKTCPETSIFYMDINNKGAAADGKKKRTKNLNSVRPIPLHSKLIEMGFLDYVEIRQADKKDPGLFKLKRNKQGRLTKSVSNWFSRMDKRGSGKTILGYIERRGVESKGTDENGQRWTKTFHSFRHTAIDNLRGKKMANGEYIREQDISLVMGHEKGKKETANYGKDRSQLELRQAVIEAIDYPALDSKDTLD